MKGFLVMINFLKGIIAGFGGIAPGLSGSVLLIIVGLYEKTLDALGSIFVNFKSKIKFLLPVVAGMVTGVLLFSKVLDFFLQNYEMPTRFCFLGLIVGTVPLFYGEVKKNGFSRKYYAVMALSAIVGTFLFTVNTNAFPQVTDPTLVQKIVLGVAVAGTAIVPGIDPAVLLSTLGLYELYVGALADFNLEILLPMIIGLAGGAVVISFAMTTLFKCFYTLTYSVIFGLFMSMIPNILNESCRFGVNVVSLISIVVMLMGFAVSYYLGDIQTNNKRIKKLFKKY